MAINPVEFYSAEIIQRKLEEYCSPIPRTHSSRAVDDIVHCTARYWVGFGEALVHSGAPNPFVSVNKSHEGFFWILGQGLDFFRAVWDDDFTLFNIDIEYFNLDNPGYAYIDPIRSMGLVETVWRRLMRILHWGYGIQPLVFQTGNGVQLTFCVPRNGHADTLLQQAGQLEWSVEAKYRYRLSDNRPTGLPVSQGLSFDGVGRLVEFLYHKTVFELRAEGFHFPITIGDVAPPVPGIREGINFDCSLYFDPLYMRDTRSPFSTHQKHRVYRQKVGEEIASSVPIQVSIPRLVRDSWGRFYETDFDTVIGRHAHSGDGGLRRHFAAATELAWETDCRIPVYEWELLDLVSDYLHSELRIFHEEFDREQHEPWWDGHTWYNEINWYDEVPPCVADCLTAGDGHRLLNPTWIRHITRTLLAHGFSAKQVAGILSMKYANCEEWDLYDQSTRANGWVRSFAGQIFTMLDPLEDFNCPGAFDAGLCTRSGPCHNLNNERLTLERRRQDWFDQAQQLCLEREQS